MISLNPYLNFNGKAEEAMNFYKAVFGGELTVSHFSDFPNAKTDEFGDEVMHSDLNASEIRFFAADSGPVGGVKEGDNISMSLSGDDDAKLTGYFNALAEGGSVTQPLEAAPWGDKFGALTDKYGINWLVNISAAQQ